MGEILEDTAIYLVVAYLFLVPWLVRFLPQRESLRWIAFTIGAALLACNVLGYVHVWLPQPAAGALELVISLAILCRLALDLFPRDRASRP